MTPNQDGMMNVLNRRLQAAKDEVAFYDGMIGLIEHPAASMDTALIGRLIEQVDRLGREVSELRAKVSMKARTEFVKERVKRETIESHVDELRNILKKQRRQFAVDELQNLLGTDKVKTIQVIRTAAATTANIRLAQGKRRKLLVSYVPEHENSNSALMADLGRAPA